MKTLTTLIFAATMATSTAATTWTGSLTSDNGIFGTEQWNQGVTLQWTVTEIDPTNWEYSYTLTVPAKDISHGIVEACGGTVYSSTSNGNGGTGYVPVAGCDGSVNSIPEPSTTTLIGLGGIALILRRRG